jgi:hypothetical protein
MRLRDYPMAVRQTLPVVIKNNTIVEIGAQSQSEVHDGTAPYVLKSLIKPRLEATLGISLGS